jgi:osmotically inducible protein OsmC
MRTSAATAVWHGALKDGDGKFSADSGAFEAEYSAGSRFGEASGTNPEELLAAAHAACFSMALAHGLAEAGHDPDLIETRAYCTIDQAEGGFAVTNMRLVVRGRGRDLDQADFEAAAEQAKDGCPISKALKGNVTVEVDARLEG